MRPSPFVSRRTIAFVNLALRGTIAFSSVAPSLHANFEHYDAIVVGSGPNGLAAAITLAQAGCSVLVLEANHSLGGGARSAELTLPGFLHDTCSAVHPLAAGSPFFKTLPLQRFGLEWIQPEMPLAHPLDDGVACLRRDLQETADSLGEHSYATLMRPLVRDWDKLSREFLQPMLHVPETPVCLRALRFERDSSREKIFPWPSRRARFSPGWPHIHFFRSKQLRRPLLELFLAWPATRLAGRFRATVRDRSRMRWRIICCELGGKIETDRPVENLAELPKARAVLFDTSAWEFARLADDQLTGRLS